MSNSNIVRAEEWFQELRNNLISEIEVIETSKFIIKEWEHSQEGGGKMSKIKCSFSRNFCWPRGMLSWSERHEKYVCQNGTAI